MFGTVLEWERNCKIFVATNPMTNILKIPQKGMIDRALALRLC